MAAKLPAWGLQPNVAAGEYRLWPAANYSALKQFRYTPAHAYQYLSDPPPDTDASQLGTATHTAILEPESFEENYVRGAAGNLTRKGPRDENDGIRAENPGKQLIRDADWPRIAMMRDSVWAHPKAREVLSSEGFTELSYLWKDIATDLPCKARIDKLGSTLDGWPCIVDFKTFGERGGRLTQHAIESVIYERQYHIQAAHYSNGLNEIAPCQRRYFLLLVEKDPPYCVRMVEIDFAAMELGKRQVRRWLLQLKRCQESNEWPGWSTGFDPMGVPTYAYSQEPEDEEG
jgi:exodeoxyribonuclease VIII